jgi:aspartate kinase
MADIHLTTICDVAEVIVHDVPDTPGIAADIFGALGSKGLNVELVVSSPGRKHRADIAFALREKDVDSALRILGDLKERMKFESITSRSDIAIITLSWHMLSGQPGSAGKLFSALSRAGINIEAISTSLSSISCVVRVAQIDKAEVALRKEFGIQPES